MASTKLTTGTNRRWGRERITGAEHLALVDGGLSLMRGYLSECGPDANESFFPRPGIEVPVGTARAIGLLSATNIE
jgi:hypothetical protein